MLPSQGRYHLREPKRPILIEVAKNSFPYSPMARLRKNEVPPRKALPAAELEGRMMAMLRGLKECSKLKGVSFIFTGSGGQEPNWFARPQGRISEACMRAFVAALAQVRRQFDLLFPVGVGFSIWFGS